jgi:16S rRNA (uracil1498-N3)-methyltransferase
MTRRRFYAPSSAFDANRKSVTLANDEARHLREVLRLKSGDEVYVFDGEGREFHCLIEESRRDSAHLKVISEIDPVRPESSLNIVLAAALLKGEKFDLVVQKATELGVNEIVPVITKLADVRLRDAPDTAKRVTRWQRIAMEAAKQCGRSVVPTIATPISFATFVRQDVTSARVRLMFSERDGRALAEAMPASLTAVTAVVGSEGGWIDEELDLARDAGWQLVTLGGRTLRAETAAIAVATLLQHIAGDLR